MEQLYNQKARNKAIIKAYLTGSHPDTGLRYLGQTGMIFAGGIAHCDDLVRGAERVLEEPAYRPVKQWLRDEGLALAAPLHSEIPKDGVEITLGGRKTKCTEEQIKELHRQGRLLLIVSDKKLELGSNFPRDSFVADAVDRFTIPAAAQRMGRGFRVDRPNPRYNHPGDPDKSCAAFNVIDETTHEMYSGTPHYPIHAIELLHGAMHRPPIPRIGHTRFERQPPEVTETMEQLGFQFIHNVEEIRDVTKTLRDGKKRPLPEKTPEWWSNTDIESKPGGQSRRTQEVIAQLTRSFTSGDGKNQEDGSVLLEFGNRPIHVKKMQAGPQQAICFLGEDLVRASLVKEERLEKTDDWWSYAADIMKKPGGGSNRTRERIQCLTARFEAGDGEVQPDSSVLIEGFLIQRRGEQNAVCFHKDDVIKSGLIQEIDLPPKTESWLSCMDIKKLPGGRTRGSKEAVSTLTEAFEAGQGDKQPDGSTILSYGDNLLHVQKLQGPRSQGLCFLREDLIAAGLLQPGMESLKSKPITLRGIKPDDETLKRTGPGGRGE